MSKEHTYFGEVIKKLKEKYKPDLKQKDLARLAGRAQTEWSYIENGKLSPRLDLIISVSEVFEINPLIPFFMLMDRKYETDPVCYLSIEDYEIICKSTLEGIKNYKKENILKKIAHLQALSETK